ncbi:MAG: zinc ribbon domain-containing protein [Bacteroidales bacterium]|nr:zinc ribbon domain-containing protein [Bacteroidales bacterium]
MLKLCNYCEAAVSDTQTVCPVCGRSLSAEPKVAAFCPLCGTPNHGDNYCGVCGYDLRMK